MSDSRWLEDAVATFGSACQAKLNGPLDTMGREAAIRAPLEQLLGAAGAALRINAVFHDEVRDTERQVRPDYGVTVGGAVTGYVEVKAPGKSVDPEGFSGHDLRQWKRQQDLPNLLYTNGTEWRLYRDGVPVGTPEFFSGGSLSSAGTNLTASSGFEALITDFLRWEPAPITSVAALVRAVAPLTRLLRGEVEDQLAIEASAVAQGADASTQPFTGLARDWRALLFPTADDDVFADGYAQAVTFALLLARTEGIDLGQASLHTVGAELGAEHSLMGKALQVLTDDVAKDFKVTLDLLVRVIGAVDWPRVRAGKKDMYLHLYEHFLEQYDNELRKQSGTYYTPSEVVEQMVRLAEEALVETLGRTDGFRDDSVHVVDPAMGTGTFLISILERVARHVEHNEGPGAVPGVLGRVAKRLNGFELQMGPYAVAELRTAELLALHSSESSEKANLFVTNTLDDPFVADNQLAQGLLPIARSRRKANEVKAKADVTVVIGNPPYRERAEGLGAWVEQGSAAGGDKAHALLDDFRLDGNGRLEYVLKNLYVYFWRWGTWKVWESKASDIDADAGIVCFITTSGYLRGPGFKGMRKYLRQWASHGWIVNLTPEGQTPDVPTRIFPGVRQPLAIGIFVRAPETDPDNPADIRVKSVSGRRSEKFEQLASMTLADQDWQLTRADWTSPLTAAATTDWDDFPALNELMPWTTPGVKANRTWVIAPTPEILRDRWKRLAAESDPAAAAALFKETPDRLLDRDSPSPLPGQHPAKLPSLSKGIGEMLQAVPYGYRSFDRQWIIPDARLIDRSRPSLWAARLPGQVFVVEQHADSVRDGPGLTFSALVPDMHHFNNRGGRALPLLHPDGSANVAPGLCTALSAILKLDANPEPADVVAYIAAVTSHPAYTRTFADELLTPGIRVPFTSDASTWAEAIALGRQVVWLHTFGEAFGTENQRRSVVLPPDDPRKPLSLTPVTVLPDTMDYNRESGVLRVGDGTFGPITPAVWGYEVGGRNVLKSWFNYRKAQPGGKKSSELDSINAQTWDPSWTTELLEVISALTQLVELETTQAALLERVLAGPMVGTQELKSQGTSWPTSNSDRAPRMALVAPDDGSMLL